MLAAIVPADVFVLFMVFRAGRRGVDAGAGSRRGLGAAHHTVGAGGGLDRRDRAGGGGRATAAANLAGGAGSAYGRRDRGRNPDRRCGPANHERLAGRRYRDRVPIGARLRPDGRSRPGHVGRDRKRVLRSARGRPDLRVQPPSSDHPGDSRFLHAVSARRAASGGGIRRDRGRPCGRIIPSRNADRGPVHHLWIGLLHRARPVWRA